ncbi:MAG: hypothetical protein IPI28_13840 [Candidatus Omnitrophica bacterium]|nr:hypothetical protein [Candidatus Omnitrophota bacterium]
MIEAANSAIPTPARGMLGLLSLFIEAVAGYPADQPDDHGFLIEGNGTTLRNLTIRNNSIDGDGQFGEAAAVQIVANDVRIENCVIESDPATSAGRCIYVFTGNLQAFDQAVQGLGASAVFGPNGYTQPQLTSSNLQVVNTTLRYGEAFFDTTDFVTYLGLLLSGDSLYIPPVPPSGSFTNVNFDGGNLASGTSSLATCDGGTYTFDNCFFMITAGISRSVEEIKPSMIAPGSAPCGMTMSSSTAHRKKGTAPLWPHSIIACSVAAGMPGGWSG